jgi:hypothetical protein
VTRYRVHYTHPDGMTTTGDYESEQEPTVGDVLDVGGGRWEVQEIEPFQFGDYNALVAVVPPDGRGQ